jgi:hypothetical protein
MVDHKLFKSTSEFSDDSSDMDVESVGGARCGSATKAGVEAPQRRVVKDKK